MKTAIKIHDLTTMNEAFKALRTATATEAVMLEREIRRWAASVKESLLTHRKGIEMTYGEFGYNGEEFFFKVKQPMV